MAAQLRRKLEDLEQHLLSSTLPATNASDQEGAVPRTVSGRVTQQVCKSSFWNCLCPTLGSRPLHCWVSI